MRRTCRAASARASRLVLSAACLIPSAIGTVGCKSLNEAYLRMEVWKYERCFGHLPPGFVPTAVAAPMAGPAMQPCGQAAPVGMAPCAPAPCQGAAASAVVSEGCSGCNGSTTSGAIVTEGVPVGGPAGAIVTPSPTPAAVTSSKPVVISDEVVLP